MKEMEATLALDGADASVVTNDDGTFVVSKDDENKEGKKQRRYSKGQIMYFIVIALCVLFVVFTACMLCYKRDDWEWGTSYGADRLATFFDGFNGRYLSNLVIMAMTRSEILKSVVIAVVLLLMPFVYKRYISLDKERGYYKFPLFLALLFLVPAPIFGQTIAYASGFVNYVLPALFETVIFTFYIKLFTKDKNEYSKPMAAAAFFLTFLGGLIVENVTLFNIGFTALIIIISFIRYKKTCATHITLFAGSVVSAVVMLSNSAYGIMAEGSYGTGRRIAQSLSALLSILKENLPKICLYMLEKNFLLNTVSCLILLVLVVKALKNKEKKTGTKIVLVILHIINIAYVIFCCDINFNMKFFDLVQDATVQLTVRSIFALLFVLTLILIPILSMQDKVKRFLYASPAFLMACVSLPFLVVQPIQPRCFFPSYVFYVIYVMLLLDFVLKDVSEIKLLTLSLVVTLGVAVYFVPLYIYQYQVNEDRFDFIDKQLEVGDETILMLKNPGVIERYFWTNNYQINGNYGIVFAEFYGYDVTEFEVIEYSYYEFLSSLYED